MYKLLNDILPKRSRTTSYYDITPNEFNPFGAIGDCSGPFGRALLWTLVDITSCNDVIKTAALRCQYRLIQRKQYI